MWLTEALVSVVNSWTTSHDVSIHNYAISVNIEIKVQLRYRNYNALFQMVS